MKYISFAIPCYNSESYMEHAIESILKGGEDVEIIIVNDGSMDGTSEIAKQYERKYPTIVKVVDSDDWVDEGALEKILSVLHELVEKQTLIDMLVSNYVYEKVGAKHKKVIHYRNVMPQDRIITWKEMGHFRLAQYILMHSVIYPKHTFYVDNIYVYYPLPHVKTFYYLDVNFYRYFIGREDQSVNEKNMIKRIDQQIFVTKTMIDMYSLRKIPNKKLRNYMTNYLAIMMTVSSIICIRSRSQENLDKKKELWEYLKKKDHRVYWKIRHGILGETINLPGKSGRKISSMAYTVANQIIGFN